MADVLAILEQRAGSIKSVSHEVLAATRGVGVQLGGEVHALVIGPEGIDAQDLDADKILLCTDDQLMLYQADSYAQIASQLAESVGYGAIILAATAMGKDLGARVAARLKCPLATDITGISNTGGIVVTRPVYAGKALLKLRITSSPFVASVRPNVFLPGNAKRTASVERVAAFEGGKKSAAKTTAIKEPERATLDVAEASIVVSGGRGLKEPENFHLVEELAEALGGAVGASRAVVDAGWRPHSEQVGQTGKTVSPNLYVAVGISGATQHIAGMRTAKVIVAINRDKDAPIFKVADYGIVGDLFEIVPKLTEEIRKLRAG
ncbi:MAG: electron transfer flavoprotein subunit alpha/FixB family protein [Gemmatimonadales bacterium]